MGKGENVGYHHFSLFPTIFSTLSKMNPVFWTWISLSTADTIEFDRRKCLKTSLGNGEMLVTRIFSISTMFYNTTKDKPDQIGSVCRLQIPSNLRTESVWKHCRKRRKCWLPTIFSTTSKINPIIWIAIGLSTTNTIEFENRKCLKHFGKRRTVFSTL